MESTTTPKNPPSPANLPSAPPFQNSGQLKLPQPSAFSILIKIRKTFNRSLKRNSSRRIIFSSLKVSQIPEYLYRQVSVVFAIKMGQSLYASE